MVDGRAPGEDAPQTDSIVLRDLSYRLTGRTIVAPCSLTLALAGRTVILGPNGAGKSTLLQLVHGMLEHSSGSVRVADTRGHTRPLAPDDLGFVMQRPVMLGRSALANVEHALAIRKVPREHRRRLALEALERVGLSGLAERYAPQLSGGEQQRLSIARAVAASPRCLLLDEPTSSLDPGAAASIERLLLSLSAQGLGIVMATHDLGQARRLASDVVFMHGGSVVESGAARAFFSAPGTEPGRRFLAGDLLE